MAQFYTACEQFQGDADSYAWRQMAPSRPPSPPVVRDSNEYTCPPGCFATTQDSGTATHYMTLVRMGDDIVPSNGGQGILLQSHNNTDLAKYEDKFLWVLWYHFDDMSLPVNTRQIKVHCQFSNTGAAWEKPDLEHFWNHDAAIPIRDVRPLNTKEEQQLTTPANVKDTLHRDVLGINLRMFKGVYNPGSGQYDVDTGANPNYNEQKIIDPATGLPKSVLTFDIYGWGENYSPGWNFMGFKIHPDDQYLNICKIKVPWNMDYAWYKQPLKSTDLTIRELGVDQNGDPQTSSHYRNRHLPNETMYRSDNISGTQYNDFTDGPDLTYYLGYHNVCAWQGFGGLRIKNSLGVQLDPTDGGTRNYQTSSANSHQSTNALIKWDHPGKTPKTDAKTLVLSQGSPGYRPLVGDFYGVARRDNPPPNAIEVGDWNDQTF